MNILALSAKKTTKFDLFSPWTEAKSLSNSTSQANLNQAGGAE